MTSAIFKLLARFFSLNESEWKAAKTAFKVGEILFKLASWITLVGLFKFVAQQSNSMTAQLIYWMLNTILFGVLVFAASSIEVKLFVSLGLWILINRTLYSIVTDIIVAK